MKKAAFAITVVALVFIVSASVFSDELSVSQITQGVLEHGGITAVGMSETGSLAIVGPNDAGHVEVMGQVDLSLDMPDSSTQTLSGTVLGSADAWLERLPTDPQVTGQGAYEAVNPMITETTELTTYNLGLADFSNAGPNSACGNFEINGYSSIINGLDVQRLTVLTTATSTTSSR